MKPIRSGFTLLLSVSGVLVMALLQSGCEEASGLKGLQISPDHAVMTTNGQTQTFVVDPPATNNGMDLPLVWTVGDEGLGRVISQSGHTAVYQRFAGNGMNTITVRDQFDNEGHATVRQRATSYSLDLTAETTTFTVGGATTIEITTATAEPPFNWRLASGPGTLTANSASRSAAYSSATVGTGVIEVTDANGASGVIAIVVEEEDADDGGDDGGGGGDGGVDPFD